MAIWLGTTSGATAVSSVLSIREQVYSPAYGEELDAKFLYQLLPSFYRNLMDDQAIFSDVWNGILYRLSADLLNVWQVDYAKSLTDIPIYSQRKWLKYDFNAVVDFTTDPALTTENVGKTNFTYSPDIDAVLGAWASRIGGQDIAVAPLGATLDEDCSLSWSVGVTVSSIDEDSFALFGYFNQAEGALANALFVGIRGPAPGSSSLSSLIIGHVADSGAVTIVEGGPIIPNDAGGVLRLTGSYSARDTVLLGTVYDTQYTKVDGTTGATASDTEGDGYTKEFTDASVNFDTSLVAPGDSLVYAGVSYPIQAVSGSSLVVVLPQLPSGASGLSYKIVGEQSLGSASVNLRSTAGDNKFTVDSFGTGCLDLTTARDVFASASAWVSAGNKKFTGSTKDWVYLDPSVETSLLSIPRLQSTLTKKLTSSDYLYGGLDYTVSGKVVQFAEPPTTVLYAEHSAYDERYIENNFGVNVGISGSSTEDYLGRVKGLYYSYFSGPTVSSLKRGTHIHLGLPVANEAGKVTAINEAYSGVYGQITIGTKGYLYPLAAGTQLEVGDDVAQFEPLCDGIYYRDYLSDPTWFSGSRGITSEDPSGFPVFHHEIQKYHAFRMRMNLDVFDPTLIGNAASFVRAVKPTWKMGLLQAYMEDEDTIDVEDGIRLLPTLKIIDSFGGWPDPYYDSAYLVDSDIDFDWLYDSSTGAHDWKSPGGALHESSLDKTASLFWNGTAEESRWLSGVLDVDKVASSVDSSSAGLRYTDDSGERTRFVRQLGVLVASGTASIDDGTTYSTEYVVTVSGAGFATSSSDDYIPTDGSNAPKRTTKVSLKTADGTAYAGALVVKVLSNTELAVMKAGAAPEFRAIPSSFASATGVLFEIRRTGPSGTILYDGLDEATGTFGGGSSDVTSFTTSGSSADFTSLLGGTGVPDEDTYLSIHLGVGTSNMYIAKIASVTNATTLVLDGTPSGGTAPTVFGGTKGWELFRCPTTRVVLGDGVATRSTATLTEESGAISDTTSKPELVTIGSGVIRYFSKDSLRTLNEDASTAHTDRSWGPYITSHCIAVRKSSGTWIRDSGVSPGDQVVIESGDMAGTYPIIATVQLKEASSAVQDWAVVEQYTDAEKVASPGLSTLETAMADYAAGYKSLSVGGNPSFKVVRPAFGSVRSGDIVELDDGPVPGTYSVAKSVRSDHVPMGDEVILSTAIADATGVTWRSYGAADLFATVLYVHNASTISMRGAPKFDLNYYSQDIDGTPTTGYSPNYSSYSRSMRMSLVDNDYARVHYDRFFEMSPDEEVVLTLRNGISRGSGVLGPYSTGAAKGASNGCRPWPGIFVGGYTKFQTYWYPSDSGTHARKVKSPFVIPLCGRKLISSYHGGCPSPLTWTNSIDGNLADLFVFEDTSGVDFTTIARDGSGRPTNPTFIVIEKNTDNSQTIGDWSGLHPRYYTLQIYDVISATQVHLRFNQSEDLPGGDPSIPGSGGLTAAMLNQWRGEAAGSAHLHYSVRDDQGVDSARSAICDKMGVWHEVTGITTIGSLDYDIPGDNLTGAYTAPWGIAHSGLPVGTAVTISKDIPISSVNTVYGVEYEDAFREFWLRRNALCFPLEIFSVGFTLTNSSTVIGAASAVAVNNLVGNGYISDNDWLQVVPSNFSTAHDDVGGYSSWDGSASTILAKTPPFQVLVGAAPAKASGSFTVSLGAVTSFTVTVSGSTTASITSHLDSAAATAALIKSAIDALGLSDVDVTHVSGTTVVTITADDYGTAGNSIDISSSFGDVVASGTHLSGGVNTTLSGKINYTGESGTGLKLIRRGGSSTLPASVGSIGTFSEWINQGSGDTITHTIAERTVDEDCG